MSGIHYTLSRVTGLNRLSIGKKLTALTLLFVAVISVMVVYISFTLEQQKSDGTVVNIAGRQRMLTQKFTKEFFLAYQQAQAGKTALDRSQLDKTERLFEISLTALSDGGETFDDPGMTQPLQLPGTQSPEIRQQLEQVAELWQSLKKEVADSQSSTQVGERLQSINAFSVKTLVAMNKAVGMFAAEADGKVQSMLANQKWIWAAAVMASGLIAWLIAQAIIVPLAQVLETTRQIAGGDLRRTHQGYRTRDELGQFTEQVESMRQALTGIITAVQQNSQQMSHSSEQIAAMSTDISGSSRREQESARQVLTATDSLQQIADVVSNNIEIANATADQTRQFAVDGIAVVHEGIRELAEAVASVNHTAEEMTELHQATGQINEIIVSIHNIADQTNLLALNAAIEAARAGAQGRGFAVVAEEVRSLAGRTAVSTTQITELIKRLTDQVEEAVASMQQVVEKVNCSQTRSQQTVAAFESMTDGINRTNHNTQEIARFNQEQMQQLSSLRERLDDLLLVLADSSQKADSSSMVATDLHMVSDHLNQMLQGFVTDQVKPPVRTSSDKRSAPRIDHRIHVDLKQEGVNASGQTRNISMTGLSVKCAADLKVGRKTELRLHLPSERKEAMDQVLPLQALIVHREQEGGCSCTVWSLSLCHLTNSSC